MKGNPNKPQNQRGGTSLYLHLLSQLRKLHMVVHFTPNHPQQNHISSSLLIAFTAIHPDDCLQQKDQQEEQIIKASDQNK